MAGFLQNLRRTATPDDLVALEKLATRLETQHKALEELTVHADRSIGQLQRLGSLGERVNALERQFAGLDHLAARFGAAESQLAGLTGTHQRLETQLNETAVGISRAREDVSTLTETVAQTEKLKGDLLGFLALEGPFRELKAEMESLTSQGDQFRTDLGRLREQHDSNLTGYKAAENRLIQFDAEWQRVARPLTETEHRIAGLEQLLADMAPIAEGVVQTRRQLTGMRATVDQLAQKSALLEQQRDQIDRATAKLERLSDLMQRADAGLERHAETARTLAELRSALDLLQEGHIGVEERTRAATERLERLELGQGQSERALAGVREGLDRNGERLLLDQRALEGISQRVSDLRRTLTDSEERLGALGEKTESITVAASRADTLAAQVAALGDELARVSGLGQRARAGLEDLEKLDGGLAELHGRATRLEESRPMLERAVRDLGALAATEDSIRDALEQLRGARQELGDTRGLLDGTRQWLSETDRNITGLRNDVAGLDRMRATMDAVRQEVEQLTASLSVVESRRTVVDEVQRRLTETAGIGASLEERARGLSERLEAAEDHLGTLVPRLDEVGRAESQLVAISAGVREAEHQLESVTGSLGGLEDRARKLEAVSTRMQELSREIDQRQNTLQRAVEHLDRAGQLRTEAVQAAELLAERSREVDGALKQVDERLAACGALSRELEGRVSGLTATQERLNAFEARLAEWRGAEQQLVLALEQTAARQGTVSALGAEIRTLYDMAERTQVNAQAVAEAEPRLSRTRTELEALLDRVGDADGVLRTLEDRRRQVDRAEERLAHADALLVDVRSVLETILAQKAQVDHFLEKAQSLVLETRRTEGLLETLREERRITDRIQTSLADLRRRDETVPERVE